MYVGVAQMQQLQEFLTVAHGVFRLRCIHGRHSKAPFFCVDTAFRRAQRAECKARSAEIVGRFCPRARERAKLSGQASGHRCDFVRIELHRVRDGTPTAARRTPRSPRRTNPFVCQPKQMGLENGTRRKCVADPSHPGRRCPRRMSRHRVSNPVFHRLRPALMGISIASPTSSVAVQPARSSPASTPTRGLGLGEATGGRTRRDLLYGKRVPVPQRPRRWGRGSSTG